MFIQYCFPRRIFNEVNTGMTDERLSDDDKQKKIPETEESIDETSDDIIDEQRQSKQLTLRQRKIQEFEDALREYSGRKMLVIIKGPPDPDSIASAWAHAYIAQNFGIETQILYFEPISHPENRALVKAVRVELIQYKSEMDLSEFSCFSFVDTPYEDIPASLKLADQAVCFSLVDHHKRTGRVKARFVDIRENAGATSSIYAEYLEYGTVHLNINNTANTELATALHHGIRSDTDNFFLAREIDWHAAAYLSRFADRDLLRQIASSSITANTMDILQQALASKEIKGNYIVAGVLYVREADRDGIGQAADYLVRREGIDTAIVFGIIEDRYIHGSLRTRSSTVDPDIFLKEVFGTDKETGKPYGGGRFDKGGFQIPLNIFAECGDKQLLWELVNRTIKSKIFKRLGAA